MKLIYKENTTQDGVAIAYYRVQELESLSATAANVVLGGYRDITSATFTNLPDTRVYVPIQLEGGWLNLPQNFLEDLILTPEWAGAVIIDTDAGV